MHKIILCKENAETAVKKTHILVNKVKVKWNLCVREKSEKSGSKNNNYFFHTITKKNIVITQ